MEPAVARQLTLHGVPELIVRLGLFELLERVDVRAAIAAMRLECLSGPRGQGFEAIEAR